MTNIIVTLVAVILISFIIWWFSGKHQTTQLTAAMTNHQQAVSVEVNGGYTPSTVVLKQGVPAEIQFNRKDPSTCLEQVVFPDFGINQFLPKNQPAAVKIDTSKAGEYDYACGMNMFHGKVIIK
ncbi:copper-binding protein [Lactobacillus sp. CBA3606]|uniref:cupredoxin domain-containing protein n=1 Tax=Lactobacillus sp. CBA3606 TaxID=2099789 RepID=UPI000CFB1133|nr:cupredoxin domain-containing protein [Lactobacillus sp. CBA3606]AVK63767.1 copper-binding protein [Lactobacillus sp. CBA3606]